MIVTSVAPDSNDVYFAAKAPNELATVLLNKSKSFYNVLESNSYIEKIHSMWRAYYGDYGDSGNGSGHKLNFTGEQGEYVSLQVNHFRNLAEHMLNIITASRPVMEARSVNTDYKSESQTYLANGILDYYMREKGLEACFKRACEMGIVMGSSFIKIAWNATGGEAYDADPETGEVAQAGELEFRNLSPLDVVVDGTKETWNNEWIMTRSWENRYNLMAKYPELAEKIRGIRSKSDATIYRLSLWSNDQTDDVPMYEFFHKKTEAMPEGRYMLFLDSDVVLLDTPMPYPSIPVFRLTPAEIMGTPYGYSDMFDILPIQEALNSMYSTIMTNNATFGVQNVWVPPNANISGTTLAGGMTVIESEVKPEALNLTASSPESYKFIDVLIQASETISGISSVTRGNPEASLKSGTALALVQSMSLQFMSGLQQSYVKMIEDVGTAIINYLQEFATTPKIVALVGKNNRTYLKQFTGDSISAISRVVIDVGNPLSHCLERDTPILMFNGSIKLAQDIVITDVLMGPDSKPRTLASVNTGEEMMYKVKSINKNLAVEYGCNENHILTLKYCSDDGRFGLKKYEVVDVSVKEYMSLTPRHRRLFMGFKTGNIDFEKQSELSIPPYILGAWLGDGHSNVPSLTSMDPELVEAWSTYGKSLGMEIRVAEQNGSRAKCYHITSGESHGHSDRNPMMNKLRELNLIKNKHIPSQYLTASRQDRLELLAGLIDTDGHKVGETATLKFTQKSNILTEQVMFLARSLGFKVTNKKRRAYDGPICGQEVREVIGELNSVTIGGNTWEIPVKLPRKKTIPAKKHRDWLNYCIEVTATKVDTFYGFTLNEDPHFVLGDFTVTHNSLAGRVQMAEQLLQMKAIDDPNQYFQVLNTGRLDALYSGKMGQLLLMQSENEWLMEGKKPNAVAGDQHKEHIIEHNAVLNDPELRQDVNLVKIVQDHIQEHLDFLRNTDPGLLSMTGQEPLPPLQPPGQGAGAPQPNQPGGPPSPPPGGQPPQGALKNSPNANVLAANAGLTQAGERVQGPGQQQGSVLPNLPHAAGGPANKNLPVQATQLLPK